MLIIIMIKYIYTVKYKSLIGGICLAIRLVRREGYLYQFLHRVRDFTVKNCV